MSRDNGRLEVIERLVDYVIQRLPQDESPHVKHFVRQYYLSVSPEDLSSKSITDLYAAVLSHWHFLYQRKPGEQKVRVFNPQLEEHGWQSTHTVIEISSDDMPFLVDSVSMALNRHNLNIHLIIHLGSLKFRRDAEGKVTEVLEQKANEPDIRPEAAIYIEIDRQSDPAILENITGEIRCVLNDVRTAVLDWPKMREKAIIILEDLEKNPPDINKEELEESIAFLRWLTEDHFTFLGYQEYEIFEQNNKKDSRVIPELDLGLFKIKRETPEQYNLSDLPPEAQKLILSPQLFLLGKTNIRSTVHRPAYTDFIAVKRLGKNGEIIGIRLFTGLYTAVAYNSSPKQIPLLRRKVNKVLIQAGFPPKSHDDRALLNILETLPRDDLFQANVSELLELSTGILHLQERQRIRLFVRKDTFGFFISCLVFVPREKFTSALSERMKDILQKGLKGLSVSYSTRFSESMLARIHYVVRVNPKKEFEYHVKTLEQKLIEAGRTWQDDLRVALVEHSGEERGNELLKRYQQAFPASYQEAFSAPSAVIDIDYFETLTKENPLAMSLYRPLEEADEVIRFKLFRIGATIPLSDVVPILENMGLRIISERPYEIIPKDRNESIWINDYRMLHKKGSMFSTESIKEIFQEAFDSIWRGHAENDGFNRLVLGAKLTWREIMILRAYAKYLWQTGFSFSQDHVEETLTSNAEIAVLLIDLFKMRFDPDHFVPESEQDVQKEKIEKALENVSNINEDRILRRYMHALLATIRTNYYQKQQNHPLEGQDKKHREYQGYKDHKDTNVFKPYFSFKLQSAKVPELPLPVPLYEVFVYSPRVEAIHLRAAKVARGGIRWSDRREDYRTEILGLMKTQQIKNAVIVPMGAKGGFVVKQPPLEGTREQMMDEVVYCYQTLIRGLLDITDNYKANEVLQPRQVVRYDEDDPYLVVAADKGTATFSNIANEIAKEYEFWLDDAFASGGSTGYDHKKMGITARGAWECVKDHFQEMGFDIQTNDFTVVGIGDMAGDVFGNGMLLSNHIRLIAAFNHMHIFVDPDPDALTSFMERQRLFNLPRSTWADYNSELISKGGKVYSRAAKSIDLSPEIQRALDFYQDRVDPNELIRAILKAPVDLFWNGGIGTYVKSTIESNLVVGDRTNDAVRINGAELRCKVVGEGGNLGFTQLGRVEYAKLGGRLNTDAIDNSGGVNCSDNEVNIKILLNEAVEFGDLTEKQRNEILAELQDEVAELVLKNNRQQARAITVASSQAIENVNMHGRLIQEMVKVGKLDRVLESLPDQEELANRKQFRIGLTRPEIAVLMAYSKTSLKESLLASDLPEDPYFLQDLERAFPIPLQTRFKQYMPQHRLKREIIATQISNAAINEMGISFISRLQDETGSLPSDIIRAYTVSRQLFKAQELRDLIIGLNNTVEMAVQLRMLHEVNRLVRRGARWFLRNRREEIKISETIDHFMHPVAEVGEALPRFLMDSGDEIGEMAEGLIQAHVPKELAFEIKRMSAMFSVLDIVEAATLNKFPVEQVATIYYAIGDRMQLGWFRELIKSRPVNNHWEALARAAFRDDLDRQQRNLTISIMLHNGKFLDDPQHLIDHWFKRHRTMINRWEYFITELKTPSEADFTMFAVALRELLDMAQTGGRKKTNLLKGDNSLKSDK
jgi:glutamate dehydrogenase